MNKKSRTQPEPLPNEHLVIDEKTGLPAFGFAGYKGPISTRQPKRVKRSDPNPNDPDVIWGRG